MMGRGCVEIDEESLKATLPIEGEYAISSVEWDPFRRTVRIHALIPGREASACVDPVIGLVSANGKLKPINHTGKNADECASVDWTGGAK